MAFDLRNGVWHKGPWVGDRSPSALYNRFHNKIGVWKNPDKFADAKDMFTMFYGIETQKYTPAANGSMELIALRFGVPKSRVKRYKDRISWQLRGAWYREQVAKQNGIRN